MEVEEGGGWRVEGEGVGIPCIPLGDKGELARLIYPRSIVKDTAPLLCLEECRASDASDPRDH